MRQLPTFKDWLSRRVAETTGTNCVAAFALPVGGLVRRRRPRRVAEDLAPMVAPGPKDQPISAMATEPQQNRQALASPEFRSALYHGAYPEAFKALADHYRRTLDPKARHALTMAMNGDDAELMHASHEILPKRSGLDGHAPPR